MPISCAFIILHCGEPEVSSTIAQIQKRVQTTTQLVQDSFRNRLTATTGITAKNIIKQTLKVL